MQSHLHLATRGDLRQRVTSLGHNGSCAGLEVVITGCKGLAEGLGGVAPESGAVLLELS
jgi:hypothetical protein